METSPSRALHRALMVWLTLIFVLSWVPLLRCLMDGPTYQWGTRYFGQSFGGRGLQGDLWLLVLQTALGVWLLYSGWQRLTKGFTFVVIAWLGWLWASSLFSAVYEPERYRFEGATLGIEVPLAPILPLLHSAGLLAAVAWSISPRRAESLLPRSWGKPNGMLLALVVLCFPLQFALLRTATGQAAADVVGVLITIVQSVGVAVALRPWGPKRPVVKAE